MLTCVHVFQTQISTAHPQLVFSLSILVQIADLVKLSFFAAVVYQIMGDRVAAVTNYVRSNPAKASPNEDKCFCSKVYCRI